MQWSCSHCCRETVLEVCSNKSQEHHPLPFSLQWKSFKGEEGKKTHEDQTSLISCHQQRGALHPHPTAADETAQPAVPVAPVRRGHHVAAEAGAVIPLMAVSLFCSCIWGLGS